MHFPICCQRLILTTTVLSLFTFASGVQGQTPDPAALAAILGQAGQNMQNSDPSALQGINTSNLPSGLAGKLQGAQAGLPQLGAKPDLGAQDAVLRQGRLQAGASNQQPLPPEAPNQFQRFVQQSTGRLLPIFGANLFDNPQAYAVDAAAPAPSEYLLGPGDEVRVQIWGAVEFSGTQTIDRNGQINLPKVGTIALAGVQTKDLESTLRKQIAGVYTNFTVNASLGKLRGITVYVVGQARQPGSYNLSSPATLVNAIFVSGGPNANGSMRNISLKRGTQTVTTIDLYDFIAKGDKSKDAALQPGDVISIAPAGPRVALTGATDHSAIYELRPGTSVQDILALGGGLPSLASRQKATIERIQPENAQTPRKVLQISGDANSLAQPLADGDLITLLPISPAFANAVTLQGNVAQPLRHAYAKGMHLLDLIPDREALITPEYYKRKNQLVQNRIATLRSQGYSAAQIQAIEKTQSLPDDPALVLELLTKSEPKDNTAGQMAVRLRGMVDQINWDYAVIERLDRKSLQTQLIPFNLGKAIIDKDPAHNLELQPGDVVTVFGVDDIAVPLEKRNRFVSLAGEVKTPGIYQVQPGETLAQLIERAGGLTSQAYAFGTLFIRESNRKQQQANLDQAVRRMESDLSAQAAGLAQNTTDAEKSSTQALISSQKMVVERLKQLKASGRVALEMNPVKPAFPDIILEDGDALTIPNKPSFVSVFGSVLAETSFIWRPGATVREYLERAGPTRYADLEGALLIRADGTVQANEAQRSFFGIGNRSFMTSEVQPGDSVFVPELVDKRTAHVQFIQGAKDWSQLLYQFGLGAAAIRTLRNTN